MPAVYMFHQEVRLLVVVRLPRNHPSGLQAAREVVGAASYHVVYHVERSHQFGAGPLGEQGDGGWCQNNHEFGAGSIVSHLSQVERLARQQDIERPQDHHEAFTACDLQCGFGRNDFGSRVQCSG